MAIYWAKDMKNGYKLFTQDIYTRFIQDMALNHVNRTVFLILLTYGNISAKPRLFTTLDVFMF